MRRGRHRSIGLAAAPPVLIVVAASLFATASASPRAAQPRRRVIPLVARSGLRGSLSEPHLARDPANPSVLVAVAQTPHALVAWRSQDSGRRWRASQPVAGASGPRGGYGAGDPVIALGPGGVALLAAVAFDTKGPCTLLNRVGSYRSQDGGRTLRPLARGGETGAPPRPLFCLPPL